MSPNRAYNFPGGSQRIKLNQKPPLNVPFRFKNYHPNNNNKKTLNESIDEPNNSIICNNTESTLSLMSISLPSIEIATNNTSSFPSSSYNNQNSQVVVSNNKVNYNPQVNTFDRRWYAGPYPINCITNARRYLIEKLSPQCTGMILQDKLSKEDFELLKLKCINFFNLNSSQKRTIGMVNLYSFRRF